MEQKKENGFSELKKAAEFLEDVGMAVSFLEKGETIPEDTLLAALPGEAEEGHFVVCNPLELDGEDGAFIRYYHLYYEIPIDSSGISQTDILLAVNAANQVIPLGQFAYGSGNSMKNGVFMRYTVPVDPDWGLSPSLLCETIYSILESGAAMEEILAGLGEGMELGAVLAAEGFLKEGM